MNIEDYLTYIGEPEDKKYLRCQSFPVNMRLFRSSEGYKTLILGCCDYIGLLCMTKMKGYKLPHGMSGANVAIPFNIIAVAINRGKSTAHPLVMINPIILEHGDAQFITSSNCGSLRLKKPIDVPRYKDIKVLFYDTTGQEWTMWYDAPLAYTIQHEIDHNNGILITDY